MPVFPGVFETLNARQVADDVFRRDVLGGLASSPKTIPCKHLYDQRGSELFEDICDLDEYYVTRCELQLMRDHSAAIAAKLGERIRLIEYGSGSSLKTRLLIDHLPGDSCYVAIDVSRDHLFESCQRLSDDYPGLSVLPIAADFSEPLTLPQSRDDVRNVVYFPGSTIGNLTHLQAQRLLRQSARLCGPGGAMLVGIDLQKDPAVIRAAYNDAQGVTAEFNLNLLARINRDLDADFNPELFRFQAIYNQRLGRVESALVSLASQVISVDGQDFCFAESELLRTEYSHKYTVPQFERLAQEAGFRLADVWHDRLGYFAVALLTAE